MRVIGPPRSGTNYFKYIIDNNTTLEARFNVGWWKHAVVPPLMNDGAKVGDTVFSAIMVRDLVDQVVSLWIFCQKGRTAISSSATEFSAFLRDPIQMQPYKGCSYYFDSPLSYLAQFYWAASGHHGRKMFFDLKAVTSNPQLIFDALAGTQRFAGLDAPERMAVPEGYLGRNPDRRLSGETVFEPEANRSEEKTIHDAFIDSLSAEDVEHMRMSPAQRILGDIPVIR